MATDAERQPVYTVGHSTRSIEEFVDVLRAGNVQRVIDVRSIPRSRTNPAYNLETLPETLSRWQIRHSIIPSLGGRRGRQKEVDPEVNAYWDNQSFHNYADYAMSGEFKVGLDELIGLSAEGACAIMCSEAVWWRCHRRIVADYLLAREHTVIHLMGSGRLEPAKLTPAARVGDSVLTYRRGPDASPAETAGRSAAA